MFLNTLMHSSIVKNYCDRAGVEDVNIHDSAESACFDSETRLFKLVNKPTKRFKPGPVSATILPAMETFVLLTR